MLFRSPTTHSSILSLIHASISRAFISPLFSHLFFGLILVQRSNSFSSFRSNPALWPRQRFLALVGNRQSLPSKCDDEWKQLMSSYSRQLRPPPQPSSADSLCRSRHLHHHPLYYCLVVPPADYDVCQSRLHQRVNGN